MVKFSTDKHAQPNFVRDSCVYANFGQCDWAFTTAQFPWRVQNYTSTALFFADKKQRLFSWDLDNELAKPLWK